ncbi:1415_t:CDS:1, partial [Gigaspora rosea]
VLQQIEQIESSLTVTEEEEVKEVHIGPHPIKYLQDSDDF